MSGARVGALVEAPGAVGLPLWRVGSLMGLQGQLGQLAERGKEIGHRDERCCLTLAASPSPWRRPW